jgi:hypothetical protein
LEDQNGDVHSRFLEDSKEYEEGKHPSFHLEKNGLYEDIPNLLSASNSEFFSKNLLDGLSKDIT